MPFMTMQYGEGMKAFVRLQEEIMKDGSDQSLFAWQQSPPTGDISSLQDIRSLDQGRSIFARHPLDFSASGSIERFQNSGKAYSLTNMGVHIELPILPLQLPYLPRHVSNTLPHHHPLQMAIMKCTFCGDRNALVGVVLQQVDQHARQFVRHDTAALRPVTQDQYVDAPLRKVYLCKNPPDLGLMLITQSEAYSKLSKSRMKAKLQSLHTISRETLFITPPDNNHHAIMEHPTRFPVLTPTYHKTSRLAAILPCTIKPPLYEQ